MKEAAKIIVKKLIKMAGFATMVGFGMFGMDRVADGKKVIGNTGFENNRDDSDSIKMTDLTEDATVFTEEDITVEDVKEETQD